MKKEITAALSLSLCLSAMLSGCSSNSLEAGAVDPATIESISSHPVVDYLRFVDVEEDTTDFMCTTSYYNVALNAFDRLVEIQSNEDGSSSIVPSLAESWSISPDGLSYSFKLHEGVRFSNGAELTSSDVLYTLTRLLTWPDSCNQDIAMPILGAQELHDGATDKLEGFTILSDTEFNITLAEPYAAFLANLSTPGASIVDEDITREAGERFGQDPEVTIGTGPFIFREWVRGDHITMDANPDHWAGAPKCGGLRIIFANDAEEQRLMFERGDLDILDLETLGGDAEYFIQGAAYRNQICSGPRVGITYLALNESVKPLDDLRVRKALQYALDRDLLLTANVSGRGYVENGIFPHGLIGYNPDLPKIPYDPDEARKLLAEAGYEDGFDFDIYVEKSASVNRHELVILITSMWSDIGVNTTIHDIDDDEFMALRKSGQLSSYVSSWSADFNDPDNFIYTFYGNSENSKFRSLCYYNEYVMARVRKARTIAEEAPRIAEYQDLEHVIVQQDAAWIPLYSSQHFFVVNNRVEGFNVSWNGWTNNRYANVSLAGDSVQ